MAAQQKTSVQFNEKFFDDLTEQEKKVQKHTYTGPEFNHRKKFNGRLFARRLLTLGAAAALAAGSHSLYRHSLYNVTDHADGIHLSYEEMNVYDENGDSILNVESPFFSYEVLYADSDEFMTSRGLGTYASWDEFVDAYGDIMYSYISCYIYDTEGSFIDYQSFNDESMTVSEFDERYIKSGTYDLDLTDISVSFSADYIENDMYYNLDDYYAHWNSLQDSFVNSLKEPVRDGTITMTYDFEPAQLYREESGLTSVSVFRYTY